MEQFKVTARMLHAKSVSRRKHPGEIINSLSCITASSIVSVLC
jgi:hypothetical protein